METYGTGEAAELLGVSTDTVGRWIDSGKLRATRTAGGRRVIEGADLAELARSVATTQVPPAVASASARNRFVGIVTSVVTDTVMAQVEMVAGRHRIVSLMSREAVDELGLAPGSLAVASVKATNVVVEVPVR